jgi:ABC-type sugar transport system ATPase subunit
MRLLFNGIKKSYGTTVALESFSAVLEPGIHALLGIVRDGK